MSKSLLLTGCAGFIGINFLQKFINNSLIGEYERVVFVDKLGYATEHTRDLYEYFTRGTPTFNIPISELVNNVSALNDALLLDNVDDVDILDFASESHVDNSIEKPYAIFEENSMLPAQILATIPIDKVGTYFHISTDEVYGDLPLEYKNDPIMGAFTTESQYKPSNPYSASKVAQDAYLESMSRTFGLNVVLIRMANQFGPFQHKEKMIPFSIYRLLNNDTVKIYGDGSNCRQWTFVGDTVKIIADIIDWTKCVNPFVDDKKNFQVIHLADQNNLLDNNMIAKKLVQLLKPEIKCSCTKIWSNIEYINDRPGHDMMYCLSVESLVQRYYKTSFKDAMEETVEYYKELYDAKNN